MIIIIISDHTVFVRLIFFISLIFHSKYALKITDTTFRKFEFAVNEMYKSS